MSFEADERLRTPDLVRRLRAEVERAEGVPLSSIREAGRDLSRWAELACQFIGPDAAAEAIGFGDWLNIEPTDAHRYLALLVRERLIDEVLTTNYDCLLERALEQSAAPPVPTRAWPTIEPTCVIWDVLTYREHAGKRAGPRSILLRLVKLNGCARAYSESAAPATTMALAERQLQDWRRNLWSEQLFRDRLRGRRLLFVGFGSDDPMVRHTSLQVVEEFASADGRPAAGPGACPPCRLPNAPFVSELKPLRFNQRQILARFCLAHRCGTDKQRTHDLEAAIRANASAEDIGGAQTATQFWEELYVRAVRRLWLQRYFSSDSPLARYLAPLVHSADSVLTAARETLTGGRPGDAPGAFWQHFATSLALTSEGGSRLGAVHLAAAGASSPRPPSAYVALADEPVGLPMLYLLWLLLHNALRLHQHPDQPVLPLRLPDRLPADDPSGARIGDLGGAHDPPSARRKVVCRFGDPGLDVFGPLNQPEDPCNHLLMITLDGRRRQPRRVLRTAGRVPSGSAPGVLRPQVVFLVPDAVLLSRASRRYRRSGLRGLLHGLYTTLLDPESLRDESLSWEDWCERQPCSRPAA
jgi:hypothetical protein